MACFFLLTFQFDNFWCNHKLNQYIFFGQILSFSTKIWENFVFSSVDSINFGNFSEIIVKIFVTKNWKKRRKSKTKQNWCCFSIDEISTKKKKKTEIQNSKMEWLWRFLITRNEWNFKNKIKLPDFYIWFKMRSKKYKGRLKVALSPSGPISLVGQWETIIYC